MKINLKRRKIKINYKRVSKRALSLVLSVLMMLSTMLVGTITADAATLTSDGTIRLYFNGSPSSASNWAKDGTTVPKLNAYFYRSGYSDTAWSEQATNVSGNYYQVNVPSGTWSHVILVRHNPSASNIKTFNSYDGGNWGQTGDLGLSTVDNYISNFNYSATDTSWGDFAPPAASVTPTVTGYISGSGTQSDPYIFEQNATASVSATATNTLSDSNIKYKYSFNGGSYSTTSSASISTSSVVSTATAYAVKAQSYYDTYTNSTAATSTFYYKVEAPAANEYTGLSAVASPAEYGTAIISSDTCTIGGSVNVTATANSGYKFTGWTCANSKGTFGNSASESTTFTPSANGAVATANFAESTEGVAITAPAEFKASNQLIFNTSTSAKAQSAWVWSADISGGTCYALGAAGDNSTVGTQYLSSHASRDSSLPYAIPFKHAYSDGTSSDNITWNNRLTTDTNHVGSNSAVLNNPEGNSTIVDGNYYVKFTSDTADANHKQWTAFSHIGCTLSADAYETVDVSSNPTVTFTASDFKGTLQATQVTGGSNYFTYVVTDSSGQSYQVGPADTTSTTASWTPTANGVYTVSVYIKDAFKYETVKSNEITINVGVKTVNVVTDGNGDVTGEASFTIQDTSVPNTLSVKAKDGYQFKEWVVDPADAATITGTATDATGTTTASFTVSASCTIKATFEETTYPVSVVSSDPTMGTVTSDSVSVDSVSVGKFTGVEITATPTNEDNYRFVQWTTTGDVQLSDPTSATTTVTATGDGGTVTAVFAQANYVYFYAALDTEASAEPYVTVNGTVCRPYKIFKPTASPHYFTYYTEEKLYTEFNSSTAALESSSSRFYVGVYRIDVSNANSEVKVGTSSKQASAGTLQSENGYLYYCCVSGNAYTGDKLSPLSVASVSTDKTEYELNNGDVTITPTINQYSYNTNAGRDNYNYKYTITKDGSDVSETLPSGTTSDTAGVPDCTYTPTAKGTYTVTLTTTDVTTEKIISSASATFTVAERLDAPTLTAGVFTSGFTAYQGTTFSVNATNSAYYASLGATLTASLAKDGGTESAYTLGDTIDTAALEAGTYTITVTATCDGYFPSTSTFTFTVKPLATINLDDYELNNYWVEPNADNTATVDIKKDRTNGEIAPASYKVYFDLLNSADDTLVYTTAATEIAESGTLDSTLVDNVDTYTAKLILTGSITYSEAGTYKLVPHVDGYDESGMRIATGTLAADPNRILTISTDPAKVPLTARLKLTNSAGDVIEEDATGTLTPLDVMQGKTLTLTGYCKNGNKPAGSYPANSITKYEYKYYYYTDTNTTPVLIDTVVDGLTATTGNPVTSKSVTFTVPADMAVDTQYHFYVEIQAYDGTTCVSNETNPNSSKTKGLVNAKVIAPYVLTPTWAENYVYFHTVADNDDDRQAWTVMENAAYDPGTQNNESTITVGNYVSASDFRVFLPVSAKNADDTYTVFNNTGDVITITDGTNSVEIANKTTGNVPAASNKITLGTGTEKNLTIYTSNTEENVYINTDAASTMGDETTSVSGVSGLVSALGFDGSKSAKTDAVVLNPNITLVDNGKNIIDSTGVAKQIKGRGNTTWSGTKKKSFNFTLGSKVSVGGMAAGKKYSILANYQDPSLARNRFLLDLADSVGVPYSSDSRFSDVYINGLYAGSYLLTEKYDAIENLDDGNKAVLSADGSTIENMDFMIELAVHSQEDPFEIVPGNSYGVLSVSIPEMSDIKNTDITQEKISTFIKGKYDALYDALTNSNTTYDELNKLIDVDSLAKVYLINELGKNYDSGVTSFYLTYRMADSRFVASPVWDFDNSLGNPDPGEPAGLKDYRQPSGWWCKYWKDANNGYTGNFMYQTANNKMVMEVAKRAWFGTGANDTKSFLYNINKFATGSADATLGANSGLQSRAYYESVLEASANNNFKKWLVEPNSWCSGHTSLNTYSLDYTAFIGMLDYNAEPPAPVAGKETEISSLLSKRNGVTYDNAVFTNSGNNGQYDYAADYMISRAYWISDAYVSPTAYYLIGDQLGGWETSNSQYPMSLLYTDTDDGYDVYAYRNVEISKVQGLFKLSDGSSYIGPASADVSIKTATDLGYHNRDKYSSTEVVNATDSKAYKLTATPAWQYVNVYFKPHLDINKNITGGEIWIAEYVEDSYTAPTVTFTTDAPASGTDYYLDPGQKGTLTATASGSKRVVDGWIESDYTGTYTYEFYRQAEGAAEAELFKTLTPETGAAEATVTVKKTTEFTVKAYPSIVTSTADNTGTGNLTIQYSMTKTTLDGGVTVYVDFGNATVSAPKLNTADSDGAATSYTLSQQGTSNIYKAEGVAYSYFVSGISNTTSSDFFLTSITDGSTTAGFQNQDQPDVDKVVTNKTIWVRYTGTGFVSNMGSGYTVDTNLTVADIPAESKPSDTAVETAKTVTPTTKRIYFTNNFGWKTVRIYYWGGTSPVDNWDSSPTMNYIGNDSSGNGIYYYDIPSDATAAIFRDNEGNQTGDINLKTTFTSTSSVDNGYWVKWENNQTVSTVYTSTAPTITKYHDVTMSMYSGTASVAPEASTGTLSYTSNKEAVATVDSTGVVTAVAPGTATITITSTGSNGDKVTQDVTVTVVDKSALVNLIANYFVVKGFQEDGNDATSFTTASFGNLTAEYNSALNIFQTDMGEKALADAYTDFEAAFGKLAKEATTDVYNIISYKTATLNLGVANGYTAMGSIGAPITNGYVQTATTTDVNGNTINYTVTYAAADGTLTATEWASYYNLSITATPAADYEFLNWQIEDGTPDTNATLALTAPPAKDSLNYLATFAKADSATYAVTYNFRDYDTSDGIFYYDSTKPTKDASYTKYITFDATEFTDGVLTEDTIYDKVTAAAPTIRSNYFDYKVYDAKADANFSCDTTAKTAQITLNQTPHKYAVSVGDTKVGDYFYQEYVTLDVANYNSALTGNVYWYVEDQTTAAERVLSNDRIYKFRVTIDNMNIKVGDNSSGNKKATGSVVVNSYHNLSDDGGKLTQNFYIVDYFDDTIAGEGAKDVKFLGAGIVFASENKITNDTTVKSTFTDAASIETYVNGRINGAYNSSIGASTSGGIGFKYLTAADDTNNTVYRYSASMNAYLYVYGATFNNNSTNNGAKMRLYSYFVYSYTDSTGKTCYETVVSDTYADANMYEAS